MTEDEISILSYGGYGGSIDLPIWAFWIFLASTMGLLLAVLIWRESMRYLILVFFGLSIFVFVPLGGMVIETGMSMMLRDFGNLALGALIAILFLRQGSTAN